MEVLAPEAGRFPWHIKLVMKDGIVEESGTHEKLMEKHGYYRELFLAQKELENFAK